MIYYADILTKDNETTYLKTYGILDNEYFVMSQNDEYNTNAIIERIINYSKRLTV